MRQSAVVLSAILLVTSAFAQSISQDELTGVWEFKAYAESSTPEERTPVGVKMEFRDDGIVISMMSEGNVESNYRIDGDTIVYSDARGEQLWKIVSHEPGETLVMENQRTLMYFERI